MSSYSIPPLPGPAESPTDRRTHDAITEVTPGSGSPAVHSFRPSIEISNAIMLLRPVKIRPTCAARARARFAMCCRAQ
jgi:hypothetical protein